MSVCVDSTLISQTVIPNKQTEKTDNLRQAVSMGLELMRTHFKRIDIRPEDLGEDDDPICMPEPIFEPYDENLARPLPLLIGCSDWNSSSYAGSSEECAEIAKVTEEVVISLPPFTQPRMAECKDSSYSDALNGKLACVAPNQLPSNIKNAEGSNEYGSETYMPQDAVAASSSQGSLLKENEVDNTTDFTSNLSWNGASQRYSEVPIIPRNSKVSLGYSHSEVSHRPPGLEGSTRLPESQIPIKRVFTADTIEDQPKGKTSEDGSNAMDKLFVDSSSDEDDLFSDLKNTNMETKQHISMYSNGSQIISISEREKTDLKTDMDVRSPDVFADVSKPKNSLKATDYVFVNDAQTSGTFRNKLDGILSSKIMSNAISGMEERQEKEITGERMKIDGTNAVLPSLAKLRAKGPPRRSPSRLLQHSGKSNGKDEVRSVHSVVMTASAEDNQTVREKAEVYKERQGGQVKINAGKCTAENVSNSKQRNDINSIFSSDSDDDIFSTLSSNSKTNVLIPKSHIRNNDVQSLPFSRERSLITSASRTLTPKTDFKVKNLFDSDDEDIFASSILVKKRGQESVRDKEVVVGKVIQEAVIPKKDESVIEKKETVVPRKKPSTSKPKRIDIFGDDSDGDLFN
uniref:CAP-ZIP_m domain-containing protein n=1 Tax=Elaeophora elaphi TaxID=1147741 RepID=A0A0R3S4M2_9BILA